MQKSEKFFIFSWKEILVISLLVLTLIGFFFTLGLHYGKKLHPGEAEVAESLKESAKLEESPENVPPKDQLDKGSQSAEPAAQEAVKAATEEAVGESNLKVDQTKPVDLPKEKAEAPKAEAPVAAAPVKAETHEEAPKATPPVATVPTVPHYAVQLGSYTSQSEAKQRIAVFQKRGLKPEIRTAEVNHETRFRVVLPGFKTRAIAETKGKELKTHRKIESYVVIKDN